MDATETAPVIVEAPPTARFAHVEEEPTDLYSAGPCREEGRPTKYQTLTCARLAGHAGDHWDSYAMRYWKAVSA